MLFPDVERTSDNQEVVIPPHRKGSPAWPLEAHGEADAAADWQP
jgi:hypothetical protein